MRMSNFSDSGTGDSVYPCLDFTHASASRFQASSFERLESYVTQDTINRHSRQNNQHVSKYIVYIGFTILVIITCLCVVITISLVVNTSNDLQDIKRFQSNLLYGITYFRLFFFQACFFETTVSFAL